jgi:cyclase
MCAKSIKSAFGKNGMFEGAHPFLFERAKQLRNNMTDAENALWVHLKQGINGCKFRRQHPIGIYIADFYCHKAKLTIEIDGSIHNDPEVMELDKIREEEIISWDYKVVRFTNEEVLTDVVRVLQKIEMLFLKNII